MTFSGVSTRIRVNDKEFLGEGWSLWRGPMAAKTIYSGLKLQVCGFEMEVVMATDDISKVCYEVVCMYYEFPKPRIHNTLRQVYLKGFNRRWQGMGLCKKQTIRGVRDSRGGVEEEWSLYGLKPSPGYEKAIKACMLWPQLAAEQERVELYEDQFGEGKLEVIPEYAAFLEKAGAEDYAEELRRCYAILMEM